MRVLLSLIVSLMLLVPAGVQAAEIHISATIFPVWLLLRQVAANVPGIQIHLVLPAGTGCPHDYALTPQDRKTLAQTDILVMNGLGMESFLGEGNQIKHLLKPGATVADASANVQGLLQEEERHEGEHQHDKNHGHRHGHFNPHIFSSPSMMAGMSLSLGAQLARLDAEHAPQYLSNAQAYGKRLTELAQECHEAGKKLGGLHVLVQHSIFSYLARDMAFTIDGFIQRHEGIDPSARDLLDLARLMRSRQTAAVITEPQYPGRSGKTLASEAGIPCVELDPVATGPDSAPADYYVQTMHRNIQILEQHFGSK